MECATCKHREVCGGDAPCDHWRSDGIIHGTVSAYTKAGCRCAKCKEASRMYSKAYTHRKKGGVFACMAKLETEQWKRFENGSRRAHEEEVIDAYCSTHPKDDGAWRARVRLEVGLE